MKDMEIVEAESIDLGSVFNASEVTEEHTVQYYHENTVLMSVSPSGMSRVLGIAVTSRTLYALAEAMLMSISHQAPSELRVDMARVRDWLDALREGS